MVCWSTLRAVLAAAKPGQLCAGGGGNNFGTPGRLLFLFGLCRLQPYTFSFTLCAFASVLGALCVSTHVPHINVACAFGSAVV